MQQIWYEHKSESFPKFRNYKLRKEESVQKLIFHKDLKEVITYADAYPKYKHTFMLDEKNFSFFRFDIFEYFEEKFSIQDLKEVINFHCKTQEKKHGLTWEKIISYIDTIYVNWEAKKFVLGEQGDIFFRLYIVYIKRTTLNTFNSTYGDVLKNKKISLIPQSFHTLMFLRNTLKKEDFILMYISENGCKIIKEQHGFYQNIDSLNLWTNALKQMYKDNDILDYRYKTYDEIERNELAKSLVFQTLDFYVQLLCKWMFDTNLVGTDIVVISPIIKNSHFIERFNKEYLKYTNNYVVPFHHSEKINTFNQEWDPEDMDALIFMSQKNM